ncbi:MAG: sodium/proline symporter PutP [Epsilonproteobacteria bacterium]|nr:sodium/proline symporter PutP [Campylobacterota bacterium]OIO15332.1 MAG: sodium/proline symporter [Helicobacteraceae bacterium CG1_02_36_14]PIP09491.1 MAG: sodium/proline symporter PutP [Sulfurimonas sp. CG23_combo_of_CG06-09_8_20_14_all_36_33]PIS27021.1 MAG: sodium/proline symporter PutP [Sulfurimonas sp. CG08_land_8_20_14_0_20_36_33]PIU35927.1 MAG: sodium/proline symporter PutP [Sulfurimonas sp. CG07_land_8_20_14_0_80_36_56]PIV04075.1 MAG: sodium/proline symporter PutP [Sulfurimonas sp. 
MELPLLISFLAYMAVMLGIGFYFYFKTDDLSDFVLGGRSLGPGVTALSAGASDMSGWLLLGLPGMMYSQGIVGSWIAVGLIIGAYLNWHYVAKPLRVYTHHLQDAITIPDYFSNRFNDNGNSLRVVTAVVILLFYTLYTSSGLVGGAKLFEATFHLDYDTALIVGSFIIVSYTFLGGYNAVSWTDFIQGILMMLALAVVPFVVLYDIGGVSEGLRLIESVNPSNLDIFSGTSIVGILSLLAWGLGYFGQPHILVRFMSIRHEDEMHRAKTIGMTWMIVSVVGSLAVGFFGLAYVVSHGVDLQDSEKIFITLSQLLFNPWIAGFLLAAILAAIMSTIDSQLLVSSSVLTRDIYHVLLRKDATDKELVWVGRFTVIAIALIAWYISTDENSSVLKLVAYAWAGFGAAFGPLVILSLYNHSITKNGAIAGMVVGALTVIIYKQLEGGIFDLYELLPGFAAAWIAILVFSKIGAQNSEDVEEIFNEVQERLRDS